MSAFMFKTPPNWIAELVCVSATGTSTTYPVQYTPINIENALIYINGILQRNIIDYNIVGKNIVFTSNVIANANITIFYNH